MENANDDRVADNAFGGSARSLSVPQVCILRCTACTQHTVLMVSHIYTHVHPGTVFDAAVTVSMSRLPFFNKIDKMQHECM